MGRLSPEALSGQSSTTRVQGSPTYTLPSGFRTTAEAPLSQEYERPYAEARSRFAPPVRPDTGGATQEGTRCESGAVPQR